MGCRLGGSRLFAQSCENARPATCVQRPGKTAHAPVAQPDRVVASEAIGRGFESLRAHQCLAAADPGVQDSQTRSGLAATRWIVRNYDLDFLKKFSLVIGFLVLVTLGLQFLAYQLNKAVPPEVSPVAVQRTQNRIAPLGAVYAGATGAAAQAAAASAAAAAAASQVAYGGTKDGSG